MSPGDFRRARWEIKGTRVLRMVSSEIGFIAKTEMRRVVTPQRGVRSEERLAEQWAEVHVVLNNSSSILTS